MSSDKARYRRNPSIVSRDIAGETILVPIRKSVGDLESIYTLNETASFVWDRLDGERTLGEIKREVLGAFAVTEADVARDLLELVEQLKEIGAIEEI
jgi:hypothetical protein